MAAITVENVEKRYAIPKGDVTALSDVSLEIQGGQFVTVLGPSGCGKSTLLTMIAGLDQPTSGRILVDGKPPPSLGADLGVVFQSPLLLDWRDALGNVMLQVEARRLPRAEYRAKALDLLEQVGLSGFAAKRPWELSGGMRQRVAICRALIHSPSLLLFDEPFGPLDALTREQLMHDLHRLWLRERQTVVFVTHSISEAVFLGDVVVVMTPRPGQVGAVIPTDDLGIDRDLEIQSEAPFQAYVAEIHRIFRKLGVLGDRASSAP